MKKKLNILIAEDTKIFRDNLLFTLEDFFSNNNIPGKFFQITKASSFVKAHQLLIESEKSGNYYDIFFADIDFTEDNKGGERDSGFKLIEKAFDICPLTKIATYSGQFRAAELWPKYEELKDKGLIVYTFDKSHEEAGKENWMEEGLKKILGEINENIYLWDLWKNHKLVNEEISSKKFLNDPFEDLYFKKSIESNLDAILLLLMNIDRMNGAELIYRMIIYIYQISLEQLCKAGKTDDEIIESSDNNKAIAEKFIGKDVVLKFTNNVNAQRVFVASFPDERIRFIDRLNWYRNRSIHHNRHFRLTLINVLFGLLTFSISLVQDKSKIQTGLIKEYLSDKLKIAGVNDLLDIIKFIA